MPAAIWALEKKPYFGTLRVACSSKKKAERQECKQQDFYSDWLDSRLACIVASGEEGDFLQDGLQQ